MARPSRMMKVKAAWLRPSCTDAVAAADAAADDDDDGDTRLSVSTPSGATFLLLPVCASPACVFTVLPRIYLQRLRRL